MKKQLILLLAFIYLIIGSGVVVSLHYCGDRLKEISFFKNADEEDCCGAKKTANCCQEKTIYYSIKDKYKAPQSIKIPQSFFTSLGYLIPDDFQLTVTPTRSSRPFSAAISLHPAAPPLYLQHRILLI